MKVRRSTIEVRKLKVIRKKQIAAMGRELEGTGPKSARWQSRFLASGKFAEGKINGN